MPSGRGTQQRATVWQSERVAPLRTPAEPGLDRSRILATAQRMLDGEGLDKFSMRRLASELGATSMSVYWYFDTKDDLLEMALDAVSGEVQLPDLAEENDWRADIRILASDYRKVLVAHPWAPRLIGQYLNVGPKSIALSVTAQRVMARSGLQLEELSGALSTLFQFVYGFSTVESRWVERCRTAGMSQDEFFRLVADTVPNPVEMPDHLQIADLRAETGVSELREREFVFGLDCVVAGIEAMVNRDQARYGSHLDGESHT